MHCLAQPHHFKSTSYRFGRYLIFGGKVARQRVPRCVRVSVLRDKYGHDILLREHRHRSSALRPARSHRANWSTEHSFQILNIFFVSDPWPAPRSMWWKEQKWGTWGRSGWAAAAGAGASRARAWDDRLRGGALGGPLRARFAAQRNRGGASDAPIVGGGGVRCGGPGLARLAAAGRAPRLRRTAEACRLVASFPCAPSRRAGGGIAAAPRVRTG